LCEGITCVIERYLLYKQCVYRWEEKNNFDLLVFLFVKICCGAGPDGCCLCGIPCNCCGSGGGIDGG
jgi:hypothetical protein